MDVIGEVCLSHDAQAPDLDSRSTLLCGVLPETVEDACKVKF